MPVNDAIGSRVRTLRVANDMSQTALAAKLGSESNSIVSKIETGHLRPDPRQVDILADAFGCTPEFLLTPPPDIVASRPWLRAYADAPSKTVDAIVADNELAYEWAERTALRRIAESIPVFDGDADDAYAIETFAGEVRESLAMDPDAPVGNVIRAAERLGCVVLPLPNEVGRHLGLSQYINTIPHIRVSRARPDVPGDRQRFTVAHELGHLALHARTAPPTSADEARLLEGQAHRFAGAFLTPHQALLDDLEALGGRVTLTTLQVLKAHWGVAIKMLVVRLRQLDRITADQATALYKQISKRGWNTGEPITVTNEHAAWLPEAIAKRWTRTNPPTAAASGLGPRYTTRWLDWHDNTDGVTSLSVREAPARTARAQTQRPQPTEQFTAKVLQLHPRQ